MSKSIAAPKAFANADTFDFTLQADDQGNVRQIKIGDLGIVTFAPKPLLESKALGASTRTLEAAIGTASTRIKDSYARGLRGEYLESELKTEFAKPTSLFKLLAFEAQRERAALNESKARLQNVPPGNEPLRATLANWFLNHSPLDRIKIALDAEFDLACAIMQVGQNIAGLDDAVWGQFSDHYSRLHHIHAAGTEASFPIVPSESFITAAGPDKKRAYQDASQKLSEFQNREDVLELAEAYLKSVLRLLMLVTKRPASELL